MLTCKEVSKLIASDALEQAGLLKRMTVRLHLLMCVNCRRFASQLRKIGATYRHIVKMKADTDAATELELRIIHQLGGSARKPWDE